MNYTELTREILLEVDRLKEEGFSIESIQQGLDESAADFLNIAGDAVVKGIKDKVAEGVIKALGFDPNSFTALVIRNAFAFASVSDWPKIMTGDCDTITGLVAQSLVKTFIDQFTQKYVADNFITNSLKFGLMESVEQSNIGQFVEKDIKPKICSMIKGGWSSITSFF
jgi:DNA-binding transcriptional MerR regulator